MNPKTFKNWSSLLFLSLIASGFAACQPARHELPEGQASFTEGQNQLNIEKMGPVEKRAFQIQAATPERFDKHTILMKMIESRAAILYLADILPEKGNPYFHMAQFGEKSLKQTFVDGTQNGPEIEIEGLYLPNKNGAEITQAMLDKDKELLELIEYFAQYIATATVLEKVVYPVLADSALILPLSESASPKVAAQFAKTFGNPKTGQQGHIQYITQKYKELFEKNPVLNKVLEQSRKQVVLTVASILGGAMEPHLNHVEGKADEVNLKAFLNNVKSLSAISVSDNEVSTIKNKVSQTFNEATNEMKAAEAAFGNVDLPDSGDIDGTQEAFEVVMRLDVGFEVLKAVKQEVMKW